MSDAMSFAEINEYYAELLSARTVLSLLRADPADTGGTAGAHGDPGVRGADGQRIAGKTWTGSWEALVNYAHTTFKDGVGDASSKTSSP
jgi:hypothetical protein